jgi:hypothetical protein
VEGGAAPSGPGDIADATAPDGGDAWAPAKSRPDETLIRALARARRRKRLLEDGTYRSAAEIAEAEGVTRSFVNRLLRLTLLAPDIAEAILEGRQSKGLQLEELTRSLPSKWEEQQNTSPCMRIPICWRGGRHQGTSSRASHSQDPGTSGRRVGWR